MKDYVINWTDIISIKIKKITMMQYVCILRNIYCIYISAVKWLIMINRIQNKFLFT